MAWLEIVTLIVLIVVALGWYLTYTAARLHRLHTRVEGSYAALDARLVRRAEAALELSNSGTLDAASALYLASAASDSLEEAVGPLEEGLHGDAQRGQVESDLTQALRLVLQPEVVTEIGADPEGIGADALARIADAHQRVRLARRFHNEAVTDAARVHGKTMVRVFRLAGHTDPPRCVEMDDDLDLSSPTPPGIAFPGGG